MDPLLIIPVANGVLPKPRGGIINGMFIMEQGGQVLSQVGVGADILVCPWMADKEELYPVGIIAKILDISPAKAINEIGTELSVIMTELEGREHGRWHKLRTAGSVLFSSDVEIIDFKKMRKEYPSISGAGWLAEGGYTEFRSKEDIPVTIYGTDLENGKKVSITANLGGLADKEHAHTIEHALIRALKTYGLCTARTLYQSIIKEADELKKSVENSIKFTMPEILGVTSSGVCGNNMTNLAQFYLAREFVDNLQAGRSLDDSLISARRSTFSKLSEDLGLTMQPGLRILQGLKKGMSHDDTLLQLNTYKKIISRFPIDPWG